jgi:hypothetical protein
VLVHCVSSQFDLLHGVTAVQQATSVNVLCGNVSVCPLLLLKIAAYITTLPNTMYSNKYSVQCLHAYLDPFG